MVDVLDIPMFDKDIDEACELLFYVIKSSDSGSRPNHLISATGAHGLVYARQNSDFKKALRSFFMNLPDGMPGVWVGKLKGAKKMKRCYGPDFFKTVMIKSADQNVNHFFCGGNTGVADQLREAVSKKFGNNHVVGIYTPPFLPIDNYDYASIGDQINRSGANVVWIGLSTPKQELFAIRLKQFTNVHFIVTVGAAFDFHTDRVRQAPAILQRSGLEWLFRLLMEPKRLYKRYFEIVPLFLYYNAKELLSSKSAPND